MMSDRTNNYDFKIDGDLKGVGGSISGGEVTQNIHTDNSKSYTYNRTEILQISEQEIISRELITTSPYKGLRPFESKDKELFFGRDNFVTSLVAQLEDTNLILLLGASGSGKSSVVRAGLIPWLNTKHGNVFINPICK